MKFVQPAKDEELAKKLGFEWKQASIDKLESMQALTTDVQEQFWAKTRSDQCPSEIKQIFTNVSRPYSALNRLGTFIQWPLSQSLFSMSNKYDMRPSKLCENGLYMKADNTLSMYDNPNVRIDCLSANVRILGS